MDRYSYDHGAEYRDDIGGLDYLTLCEFDRFSQLDIVKLEFKRQTGGLYTVKSAVKPKGRQRWRRVLIAHNTPLAELAGMALGAMGEAIDQIRGHTPMVDIP